MHAHKESQHEIVCRNLSLTGRCHRTEQVLAHRRLVAWHWRHHAVHGSNAIAFGSLNVWLHMYGGIIHDRYVKKTARFTEISWQWAALDNYFQLFFVQHAEATHWGQKKNCRLLPYASPFIKVYVWRSKRQKNPNKWSSSNDLKAYMNKSQRCKQICFCQQ